MMQSEARGCSLWLVPPVGPPRNGLAATIATLARRFGTPVFAPHITLLGSLAGDERALLEMGGRIAGRLAPVGIRLGAAEGRDELFRCLYLAAEPSEALRSAHGSALAAAQVPPRRPFEPHLSLLYANLSEKQRTKLCAEIGESLACSFTTRALELHRTQGPVGSWRRLASWSLG